MEEESITKKIIHKKFYTIVECTLNDVHGGKYKGSLPSVAARKAGMAAYNFAKKNNKNKEEEIPTEFHLVLMQIPDDAAATEETVLSKVHREYRISIIKNDRTVLRGGHEIPFGYMVNVKAAGKRVVEVAENS